MVYQSSVAIDSLTPQNICDENFFNYAKTQYIIYDILYKAYMMPAKTGFDIANKKSLGDLSISRDNNASVSLSSGIDTTTAQAAADAKKDWERIVLSGGCLNPGQGVLPTGGLIGILSPDRVIPGRGFISSDQYAYASPYVNTNVLPAGHFRKKGIFRDAWPNLGGRYGYNNYTGRGNVPW